MKHRDEGREAAPLRRREAAAGDGHPTAAPPTRAVVLLPVRHGAAEEGASAPRDDTARLAEGVNLAEALGTCGHVTALRRTAVAGFTEQDAVLLDAVEATADRDALLRPVDVALRHLPELRLAADDAARIRNGGAVLLRGGQPPIELAEAWASVGGRVLAIGSVRSGHFHPSRVLKA